MVYGIWYMVYGIWYMVYEWYLQIGHTIQPRKVATENRSNA